MSPPTRRSPKGRPRRRRPPARVAPAPPEPGEVVVYTDGGASPNPGPGGWGAVLLCAVPGSGEPAAEELSGGEAETTNNRMELTAAIRALEELAGRHGAGRVRVVTDSQYLRRGITSWLPAWEAAGWRRKRGDVVANEDLWRRLSAVTRGRAIRWDWVKGHAGHRWNERADALATAGAAPFRTGAARSASSEPAPDSGPPADHTVFLKASGRGGWAARVVSAAGEERLLRGARRRASANELILIAAAEALESLPARSSVAVYTAADYLRDGADRWLPGWRSRGWKTKSGGAVANREAWQRLSRAMDRLRMRWPRPGAEAAEEIELLGKVAHEAARSG